MINKKTHIDVKLPEEIFADLENRERKLREIIDMLPETVFEIDLVGRVTFVNDAGLALFGYSRDDFAKGLEAKNMFCAYEMERMYANLKKILDGERNQSTEYMAQKKDGTVFPVLVHSRPILKENSAIGTRGILIDLTENYKIRKQLEREKNFIDSLLDTANSLIVCLDSDEKILVFNKECEKITGYTFEEVRGKDWREMFIPGENRRPSSLNFSQWIKKHPEDRYEGPLMTKSGEIKTILWSNTVFSPPDSDEIMAVAIGHDITKKKSAESALKESEQRYSLLFQNVSESVVALNKEGVFEMMNIAAANYLGGKPKDFIGKKIRDLFPPEAAKRQMANTLEVINESKQKSLFQDYVFANNEKKWFKIVIYPVKDKNNVTSSALLIGREVTEEVRKEIILNARFKLFDELRKAQCIDDCLELGCRAIFEAELYRRSVLTLHNEISNLGHMGLDDEQVSGARKGKAPSQMLSKKITRRKFSVSNSYFIPAEAALNYKTTNRYIPEDTNYASSEDSWQSGDELFVPVLGSGNGIEGWLSVDTPFDGKRPTYEIIRLLEEITDIVTQRAREISNQKTLAKERKSLAEKNVAMKEILDHIEEEKAGFKQRIAENIDQVLLPVLNRMIDDSGNISKSSLFILKNNLKDLGALSGGITQLYSRLSTREVEICNLIKMDWTSKEIANRLKISVATVHKHRETIRRKLDLTNNEVNLQSYLKNL